MIFEYEGRRPQIGQNVFIAPTATIIGDVHIGDGASIWYGVVLRGDEGRIEIGRGSNVQDNSVIHTTPDIRSNTSEHVRIGKRPWLAVVTIGSGGAVGTGCSVVRSAVVGVWAT